MFKFRKAKSETDAPAPALLNAEQPEIEMPAQYIDDKGIMRYHRRDEGSATKQQKDEVPALSTVPPVVTDNMVFNLVCPSFDLRLIFAQPGSPGKRPLQRQSSQGTPVFSIRHDPPKYPQRYGLSGINDIMKAPVYRSGIYSNTYGPAPMERSMRRAQVDGPDTQKDIVRMLNQVSDAQLEEYAQQAYQREKRLLSYSHPPLKESVDLAWPIVEYAERRSKGEKMLMLFFDISRNPAEASSGSVRLLLEDGVEAPPGLLEECMQMEFSPTTPFTMIQLKCEQSELGHDNWDVVVQRPNGIRIIDIFEEIYKTYNTPLQTDDYFTFPTLTNSPLSQNAFYRRSNHVPALMEATIGRGMCRVDLMGDRTLFNGVFFNADMHQYHFQLLEQDPADIISSRLYHD
ncbi:hypothetical protein DXG01_015496 [Tephrocybe rancida]|nr:hypothetical protein DXG01_015496 [Tephrocybe rancida]